MGTHYTMCGKIHYDTYKAMAAAVDFLQKRGWLKDDKFVDASEEIDYTLDWDRLIVVIPLGFYRNLAWHTSTLTKHSKKHVLLWTCSDGDFYAGSCINGTEEEVNLTTWASEPSPYPKPQTDDEWAAHGEWHSETEQDWMEEMADTYDVSP